MAKKYYQLDERTRITTDTDNWMLQKPVKKKDEIIWESYKWFSNFKSCINSFAEEQVREHWADFEKILEKLNELKSKLEDVEKCFNVY